MNSGKGVTSKWPRPRPCQWVPATGDDADYERQKGLDYAARACWNGRSRQEEAYLTRGWPAPRSFIASAAIFGVGLDTVTVLIT